MIMTDSTQHMDEGLQSIVYSLLVSARLTLPMLKYFCINRGEQSFFHFEIITNVLVCSFRFIWIPMLWVYGHNKYFLLLQCVDRHYTSGPVFSYKLRYIVGFWLVEMAISTNQKPTIYRNLYENTAPESDAAHVRFWRLKSIPTP